jgi:glycosyltransferase involved in cell wall biosynthesis
MSKLVSVIMPARNAGDFIKKSIDSVLAQTYPDFELIIIDDKSTDNTREIAKSYADVRIKIVDGPGIGISAAFNTGLENAKGDYFCRCDADDLFPEERLMIQVQWLNEHPEYVAICGSYTSIDEKGRHILQYHKDTHSRCIDSKFQEGHTITHFGTFLIKTEVIKSIGGCRSFFKTAEDIDLQLRMSQKGAVFFMAKNFYRYRLHNLSITHNQPSTQRKFFEAFAKECHRERVSIGTDALMRGDTPDIPDVIDEKQHTADSHMMNQLISESWYWFNAGHREQAFKSGYRLVSISPFSWLAWRNLMLLILKSIK